MTEPTIVESRGGADPEISVVVPVYKEQDNILPFLKRTETTLEALKVSYEIIFCLDPSPDRTEEVIVGQISRNANIRLMIFSRRFGQPAATMAGILNCRGRYCVVIDVDLQDPPELIEALYRKACEGYEVVYAKRRSRKGETWIKRLVASMGYRLINKVSEAPIPRDVGDFRILSRRVIDQLGRLSETHGFLRGLVGYIGFRQSCVEYDRQSRVHGPGNYNRLLGSIKIAFNGLMGFTVFPLQAMWILGLLLMAGMLALGIGATLLGMSLSGIFYLSCGVGFLAGLQLFSLGIMGEYVGRIYQEVRRRPMYIIDRKINW
ncbi:MAG: glycosyltransferase family 2 protein [Candidatus Omnitrophota bacterium]